MNHDLTDEEQAAIRALQRLAKKWPKSLWLYSASGTLHVMRKKPDGRVAMTRGDRGYVDRNYQIAVVNIENDGGDW